MTLQKGAKVKIRNSDMDCFTGRIATVDHPAPDNDNTTVYRLRIGDMVLPGWYRFDDLEPLYRPYTTLIIDFEGTISDTSEGVIKSMAHALEHFNIQFDEEEDLRKGRYLFFPFLINRVGLLDLYNMVIIPMP